MATQKKSGCLVGQWFHSFTGEGETRLVRWQGRVVGEVAEHMYLVQLYEWAMGMPSTRRIVRLCDMLDWDFYETSGDMHDRYERVLVKDRR